MRFPITNSDCHRFALRLSPRARNAINYAFTLALLGAFLGSSLMLLAWTVR